MVFSVSDISWAVSVPAPGKIKGAVQQQTDPKPREQTEFSPLRKITEKIKMLRCLKLARTYVTNKDNGVNSLLLSNR